MQADLPLVAIVDDEESVRRALGRLLGAAGFNVLSYGSGPEFLAALARISPQCLVLDLRMPRMSGFEVQDALLEAKPELPVVIITGDDSPDARQRTLDRGAKAYLRKPVDEAMLLDAINSAIQGAALRP